MSPETEAHEIIATVRREVEQAADLMLSAAEMALKMLAAARAGDVGGLDRMEPLLLAILEACAFQDLTGQRLSKLDGMITTAGLAASRTDPLLNGPARTGEGLNQDAADAILGYGT